MEERKKIIIPTGSEAEETLSTPHFDAEATLLARPVVPLAETPAQEEAGVAYAYGEPHGAAAAQSVASSPWKRSTLVLIILAAVSLGVASGFAIGLYQTRGNASAATPVAAQPPVVETQEETVQAQPEEPAQTSRVEQVVEESAQAPEQKPEPETEAQIPVSLPDKETKKNTDEKNRANDEPERNDRRAGRDNSKRDDSDNLRREEVRNATRGGERDYRVDDSGGRDDERDDRIERRERRREERREERRRRREENADDTVNVPRNARERTRQEINRIRDIFEGRQP